MPNSDPQLWKYRKRCQHKFPLDITCECKRCVAAAEVRHHKSRDVTDNRKKNVQRLCKKCHKAAHPTWRNQERDSRGRFKGRQNENPRY